MVSHPGAEAGADRLRPLNEPRPVAVRLGRNGLPSGFEDRGRRQEIASIEERWVIEEEWWREPLRREYLTVMTTTGSVRPLYSDTITGRWFLQNY